MKKVIATILIISLLLISMSLIFVGCNDVGEAALEIKPTATMSQDTGNSILTITLVNKNNGGSDLKNVMSGKASRINITIESVRRNKKITVLDTIWVKYGSGENKDYVELIKPDSTEETGYNINEFEGVYYKGYAMKVKINLTKYASETEDVNFLTEDRFIKVIVNVAKGYDLTTVDFSQSYFFDNFNKTELTEICTISTNIESYDQSVRTKDVEKFYIYKGYSINDFKDYPNIICDYNALCDHLVNRRYANDPTVKIKDLSTNEYISNISSYVFTQSTTLKESIY